METNKTPREIVKDLDQYIVGQDNAKRAVAIALRNRYRRMQLDEAMQNEVTPKNILMIGPTGVGKTEIARRLARVVNAPFVKVEATKFTEVGYVGRDVESMVRDLLEASIRIEEDKKYKEFYVQAKKRAEERLVKLLVPGIKKEQKQSHNQMDMMQQMMNAFQANNKVEEKEEVTDTIRANRASVKEQLEKGLLETREITVEVDEPRVSLPMNNPGLEQMGLDLGDTLSALTPNKKIKRTLSVKEARELLIQEESSKLINKADIHSAAIKTAENNGIIFIDEFDKITAKSDTQGQVSREGVQRDILPIVEGSQVTTKYGVINTDHILFIASGAFHLTKPSDLIPELQGRFPIRVELEDLSEADFVRILTEPENALVKQYIALLGTENIKVTFSKEAIQRIAAIAYQVNTDTDNIGARRLHTILEKLLEDLLFEAAEMQMGEIMITEQYVNEKLGDIVEDQDLSRYIL